MRGGWKGEGFSGGGGGREGDDAKIGCGKTVYLL